MFGVRAKQMKVFLLLLDRTLIHHRLAPSYIIVNFCRKEDQKITAGTF